MNCLRIVGNRNHIAGTMPQIWPRSGRQKMDDGVMPQVWKAREKTLPLRIHTDLSPEQCDSCTILCKLWSDVFAHQGPVADVTEESMDFGKL